MKEKLKKNEAITLISLVVTIIVLIILAGVSINLTLGQDGIITKAKQAKQNMELAQIEEQEQLNQLYSEMIGESINSTSDDAMSKLIEFKKQIASAITDMGVETSENADVSTMASNIRNISKFSSINRVISKVIATDMYESYSIDASYTVEKDGLMVVVEEGATAGSSTPSYAFACKKNDINITELHSDSSNGLIYVKTYIFEVSKGDNIYCNVLANAPANAPAIRSSIIGFIVN